jgi:hypothetical protein
LSEVLEQHAIWHTIFADFLAAKSIRLVARSWCDKVGKMGTDWEPQSSNKVVYEKNVILTRMQPVGFAECISPEGPSSFQNLEADRAALSFALAVVVVGAQPLRIDPRF